jgi:lipoyl(octanoyl) transferase
MASVTWLTSEHPVAYTRAIAEMEDTVSGIFQGTRPETVWLLEHPHLLTAGTSADASELLNPGDMPVFPTGRGGRYTYHGPGQRVAYVMLDLSRRGSDLHAYVAGLENWIIATLSRFGISGERRSDRVGVWVTDANGQEAKIAAIGVRVRRWVTYHGIAINLDPDLARFSGIIPCGIRGHGVTSIRAQGVDVAMAELDDALRATFSRSMPPVKGNASTTVST